jgi:hypothetical protein
VKKTMKGKNDLFSKKGRVYRALTSNNIKREKMLLFFKKWGGGRALIGAMQAPVISTIYMYIFYRYPLLDIKG